MKCQAEQAADTNQVGSDFRQQPATFDKPGQKIFLETGNTYNKQS